MNSSVRQQVLVLYLANSALDSPVAAWARYDGTGTVRHQAGGDEEPPYKTGLAALQDGWRLIQASPLINHQSGDEFRTGYFKYEFFFEKLVLRRKRNVLESSKSRNKIIPSKAYDHASVSTV